MAVVLNARYHLDDLPVGRGGMGEVWLGRDVKLDREVAVKLIRFPGDEHDEEFVRRFVRESRITARLEHPGVPAVYDVGTHEGRPFMVMERVHGVTVADLVAEHGPLPVGWAAAIAAQTCAVLAAAHDAALVHRDLKPGNLMLCPDGRVRVLDFGLAVALASGDSQITRTGQSLGTPAYMAPELVLAGETTPRTDLYALGCTLHEMLTGRALFRGSTAYAVMSKHVDERPAGVRSLRPDVPAQLEGLVLELLAKTAAERPADAVSVYARLLPLVRDLGMLAGVLAGPDEASPARMFGAVLARVFPTPAGAGPESLDEHGVGRDDIVRARTEAASLVRRSCYSDAASVLAAVVDPATELLGVSDPDVVSLRFELANIRFDGGDFRAAAPVYGDLAAHLPADDDLALRCRRQAATCHALAGDTERALRELDDLLADERRIFGPDHERVPELQLQLALLQRAAGRPTKASASAREALAVAERALNPDHPTSVALRELLKETEK